jgi:peroxiredoxin
MIARKTRFLDGIPMLRVLSLLLLTISILAAADAEKDWQQLIALDAGPGLEPKTPADALQISLTHLDNQEKALRGFLQGHPKDPRAFHARLRLARLLALRAELKDFSQPAEVETLMTEADQLANTPKRRADYDFARLGQKLRQWQGKRPDSAGRTAVLNAVRQFQGAHPKDHRIPALLLEAANLFEGAIRTKEPLLREANRLTNDPELKGQIADDLKRLAHLGKVLNLRFTGLDGLKHDVKDYRGKPVLVLFFATASEPARTTFAEVQSTLEPFGDAVGFMAVSLDAKREDVLKFLEERKITLPVAFDGEGWSGATVTKLGVNAVPSAWLLDKEGVVRTLDALENTAALIRQLQ